MLPAMMNDQNLLSTIGKAQGNNYFQNNTDHFRYSGKNFQQQTFHFVYRPGLFEHSNKIDVSKRSIH